MRAFFYSIRSFSVARYFVSTMLDVYKTWALLLFAKTIGSFGDMPMASASQELVAFLPLPMPVRD